MDFEADEGGVDRCFVCRQLTPADFAVVAAEGWFPCFYDRGKWVGEPVCGTCLDLECEEIGGEYHRRPTRSYN